MADGKIVIPGENIDTGEGAVAKPDDLTPEQLAAKEAEEAAAKEAEEAAKKAALEGEGADTEGDSKVEIDGIEYKLDDNGNALSDDGTVFKTKDEIDALPGEDDNKLDIDGVIYTIDKDGNAVDDKGNISYTKEDIDKMDTGSENELGDVDLKSIMDDTKLIINDEQGNPIEYENTKEGLEKYVEDVYTKASSDATTEQLEKLYTAYPFLPNLFNHLQAGGTFDDFANTESYANVTLDNENEAQLKSIITKARSARGDSQESIDRYYNYLKSSDDNNDAVVEEAERELKYLKDSEQTRLQQQQELIDQQQKTQQEQLSNYWGVQVDEQGKLINLNKENSVYSIIKNKTIKLNDNTFKIPDKIRVVENGKANLYTPDDFFNYLYEPIVVNIDGKRVTTTRDNIKLSQEQEKRNINNDLYDAFLRFTNYDKSQFINEQIKNSEVQKIKKLSAKRLKKTSNHRTPVTTKGRIVIKK